MDELGTVAGALPNNSCKARLGTLVSFALAHVDEWADHCAAFFDAVGSARAGGIGHTWFAEMFAESRGLAHGILEEGLRAGTFDAGLDPEATAEAIVALYEGSVLLAVLDVRCCSTERLRDAMLRLVRHGLPPGGLHLQPAAGRDRRRRKLPRRRGAADARSGVAIGLGHDATLITEVVHELHTGGPELQRDLAVLDPVRLFRSGLFAKLLVHNPTGWEIEAGGAGDLADGGSLVQLLARYNAGDRVDLEVGVDLLFSGGSQALAPIADNDRLVTRIVLRM